MKTFCGISICRSLLGVAAGTLALTASADIFYAGNTKGLPGANVDLSINARAGTTLEAIQIVPEYAPVADLLELVELASTPALRDDGFGDCNNGVVCAVVYVDGKSFAADTLLATLRFTVASDAPPGPVPFDAGVIVGEDVLPIPPAQNFEVLAIPEPQHWILMLAGLGAVVGMKRIGRGRWF